MESLPHLELMPRVGKDIARCLQFISRQPWGKSRDRKLDIDRGIVKAWSNPMSAPVRSRVRLTGLEMRCVQVAQFVIVYAYLPPNDTLPHGAVSIRAVRHRRTTLDLPARRGRSRTHPGNLCLPVDPRVSISVRGFGRPERRSGLPTLNRPVDHCGPI
jgi:hypothetical protein